MEINCKFWLYICRACCQRSILKVWQSICGNVRFTCRCHRNSEQRIRTKYRLSLLHIQLYQWWVPARFIKSYYMPDCRKDEYYQKTWLPKYMYMYIPCTGFWMAYIFPYQQKNNRRTNWKKSVQMIWCNNMKKLSALIKL